MPIGQRRVSKASKEIAPNTHCRELNARASHPRQRRTESGRFSTAKSAVAQ